MVNINLGVFAEPSKMREAAGEPLSPVWWAVRLAKQLADQSSKSSIYAKLERYYQGEADLPHVPDHTKQEFYRFQKKSRTNFAGLVVDAVSDRLSLTGWTTSRQEDGADLDEEAWNRWKDAGLEVAETELISNALRLGEAYAFIGKTAKGRTKVSVETPLTMAVERDEDDEVIAAGKYVHDTITNVSRFYVYLPGETYIFEADMKQRARGRYAEKLLKENGIGDWRLSDDSFRTGLSHVPVFVLENLEGKGEFEKHIDLLDRINDGVLNRAIIIATQAHRQRMFKQQLDEDGEPQFSQYDEDGNEYDWSSMIPSSPGEVGVLPPGVDIWESSFTDLSGIINAVKSDISDLAAVTNTLIYYLLPGSENTSAKATDQGNEAFLHKVKDRQKRFKLPFEEILKTLYEIDGEEAPERVAATFANPMSRSITQIGQAWSQMTGLPLASKLKYVMQLTPSEIQDVLQDANEEALQALMFSPEPVQETPLSTESS